MAVLLVALIFVTPILGKGLGLAAFGGLTVYSGVALFKQPKLRAVWGKAIRSPYGVAVMVTLALWLLSALCGLSVERSFRTWLGVAGLALAAVSAYPLICRLGVAQYLSMSRLISWGMLVASVVILICYSNAFPAFNALLFDRTTNDGMPMMRVYSTLFAISIPFVWLYALKQSKVWGTVIATCVVLAIILAAGRSGWLALAVAVPVFAVLFPWRRAGVGIQGVVLYVVHLLVATSAGYALMKYGMSAKSFAERMTISADAGTGSRRVDIWQFALEKFSAAPWFGIGPKGYRHLDFADVDVVKAHPHNMFIEILLETGIVGLTAFVVAALLLLWLPLWRNLRGTAKPAETAVQATLFTAFAAYLTAAQLTTAFFHLWWTTYFAVLVLLIVAVDRSLVKRA